MIKTRFKDLFLIQNISFKDNRGYFKEIIREEKIKRKFPFLVMSFSKRNVIRGLHLQKIKPQAKLITVAHGEILDVVVDLRKNSKTFGKYVSVIISDKSDFSFLIPKGFAHGFSVLSQTADVFYDVFGGQYSKDHERGLRFDDSDLNIDWGFLNPLVSEKDMDAGSFKDFKSEF